MTRVAVIGAGSMGRNHTRVYREIPDAELVGVVDENRGSAEEIARLNNTQPYDDLSRLLDEAKPEAVTVAVPTQVHYEVVKQALEGGCHILVEKPIAATVEEAQDLMQLAKNVGKVLMVGHIERFNPAIIELKKRLETGQL